MQRLLNIENALKGFAGSCIQKLVHRCSKCRNISFTLYLKF